MLDAGESLGTRYKVSKPPDVGRAGAFFEAIDRGSTVVRAQLLGELALSPAQHSEVRRAVTALPALASLLRPRDLVLSSRSLPVAIFDRPALEALRPQLADMTVEKGKRQTVTSLLRWVALVASDLFQAHGVGVIHGAISSQLFAVNTRNGSEPCLLTGFGISAAARSLSPAAEVGTVRRDLVDLLASLHDLFLAAGAQPEGSASSKWTLLRHSAMHGEHPALASAMSLANALNEIASLPDDADSRPVRMPTIAPPPRPGARSSVESQPAQPRSPTERSIPSSKPRTTSPPAIAPAQKPPRVRFSWPIVLGGSVVAIGVVSAGVYHLWEVHTDVSTGRVREVPLVSAGQQRVCEGEPMSPVNSVRTDHQPVERSATCSSDGQRIVVGARVEGSMFIASRGSARGSGWAGLAVAHGVVEAGTVLSVEGTEWAVWRNGVGPPIGLARMRGAEVAVMGVPLQGWDVVPLRGAFVAHATDRDVYVVTNVESDRDSHAVLLDVALGPLGARRPVVSWFLGEGTAEAIIQGSDPVLLMHQPSADGHALSVVTVHPQALGRAPLPADVSSVRGATLPTTAIERSATVTLAGEAMQVAPHGVSATLTFMVGTGPARVSDDCQTRARCPGAGRVSLVTFGPGAAPVVREIDSRAWIEDLAARQGSSFDALTVGANPRGEPLATHSLRSFSAHEPAQQPTMLRGVGTVGALSLRCGQDLWGVFVSGTADGASNIGALPLACLSGR